MTAKWNNNGLGKFNRLGSNYVSPSGGDAQNLNGDLIFDPQLPPVNSCRITFTPTPEELYRSDFGELGTLSVDYDAITPVRLSRGFGVSTITHNPFAASTARFLANYALPKPKTIFHTFESPDGQSNPCRIFRTDEDYTFAESIYPDASGETDFQGNPYEEFKIVETLAQRRISRWSGSGFAWGHGVTVELTHSAILYRRRDIDPTFATDPTPEPITGIVLAVRLSGLENTTPAVWKATEVYQATTTEWSNTASITSKHGNGSVIDQFDINNVLTSVPTEVKVTRS